MPKFTLIAEHLDDNDNPTSTVTHVFNEDFLPEVVMMMQEFLRGVGFYFNGELNISEPVRYTATDLGKDLAKMEAGCCGGCNSFEDKVDHNDFYYDINRNR